tara:strand:+ start:4466 stop:5092 length:627 start_codon:yes stop_codon:yes gene_type:complete
MKIAIFYHIAQMGMSAFIYQQQLHRLYTSGLIDSADYIHFGVNGYQELFNVPDKAIIKQNSNWEEETDTLISLKEFCDENSDYKVLYFHTKGVSRPTIAVSAWRLMMEYFVIDRWKDCIDKLSSYNAVSCCLSGDVPPYSFVGNFWWADSSYIQTLGYYYLSTKDRTDRERWISTGYNFNPKALYKLEVHNNSLYWDIHSEFNYIVSK